MLAPVYQRLVAAGCRTEFLALTTAQSFLANRGIPCRGFRDIPGATDPAVQAHGRRLAAQLPAGGPVAPEETIAYLGLSYLELEKTHGVAGARQLYESQGRQAFLPVETLRKAIEHWHPRVVVATNSPRAERAAIIAAGEAGLPSVCAVDMFALQEVDWIGKPGYASRVCVLNESVRQMFLDAGRHGHEVIVTGNPAFDGLTSARSRQQGKKLREERRWDDGRVTVLWASQVEPDFHPFTQARGDPALPRLVESRLRHLVSEHRDMRLVVRYHPSERETFRPDQRVEFSPTTEDLAALLHAVDLVVVTASTVGLEAHLAGRPVVSVDLSVFTKDAPFSRMGIATGVADLDELGPTLLRVKAAGLKAPEASETSGDPESSSTARITTVIQSLI
jgi:hypothetical protein